MIYELKDVCTPLKGTQIDTTLLSDNNPFKYINGGTKESGFYIESNTPGNTVIVSEGGASCGYVNYIDTEFWCGCHCYKLVEPKINAKYLYYALKANQSRIMELRTGAAMPNIKKSTFIHFKLDLTNDKEEQNAIVSELDKIQAALDNKKEQLKKLDELIQSKFYEMFGDPVVNDKGWDIKELGEICELKAGKNIKASELYEIQSDGLYPCYGGNGLRGYINKYSHQGTFSLIGRQGALCGNVKLAKGLFYATEHAVVVTPRIEINALYVYYVLTFLELNRYAKGVAQPGISVQVINGVYFPLPPLPLQQAFAAYVEKVEQAKTIVNQEIAHLQELLDSRMDFYFRK